MNDFTRGYMRGYKDAIKEALNRGAMDSSPNGEAQPDQETELAYSAGLAEGERIVIEAELAQPEQRSVREQQEPVAWMTKDGEIYKHECWPEYEAKPLYTTHLRSKAAEGEDTQRAWVGLTEMEKAHMAGWYLAEQRPVKDLMHLVEAKLKEKNERLEKNT